MHELEQTREELAKIRAEIDAAEDQRQGLRTAQIRAQARIAQLQRTGAAPHEAAMLEARREEARVERELAELRTSLAVNRRRAAELADHLLNAVGADLERVMGLAGGDLPFLLLPVRIETRFARTEGAGELRVRIFPDDVQIDAHERELTGAELAAGRAFWLELWPEREANGAAEEPWRRLLASYDPRRAAWIVSTTAPGNVDSSDPAPSFPQVTARPEAWSRAAHSRVLPDRWVVVGYDSSRPPRHVVGRPILDPLPVGPSPDEEAETLDDLPLDREVEWLVDFDQAEVVGMAVRMPFPDAAAFERGFDRLIVLGVKISAGRELSRQRLAELIDAHRYSGGFALVPQGTPTNNTPEGRSGYSTLEADAAASLALTLGDPQYQPTTEPEKRRDGQRLAEAFGLDPAALDRVARSGGAEEQNARAMATALWPVTWGYYLEQLVGDALPRGTVAAAREHFISWTRGRGPLAAVRVGDMPYGVLPAGAFSRWAPDPEERFEGRLLTLLGRLLDRHWRAAIERVPQVRRDAEGKPVGDPEDALVGMLGLRASSSSYKVRQLYGEDYVWNLMAFTDNPLRGEIRAAHRAATVEPLRGMNLADADMRLAGASYDPASHLWRRSLVQPGPLSETEPLAFNYIHWLRTESLQRVREQDFGDQPRPRSLLYALLRHAVLLTYVDTGLKIKQVRALIDDAEMAVPELVNVRTGEERLTPWQHLSVNVPDLTGRLALDRYLAQPDLPDEPELNELAEVKKALAHLETLPTAELERLLTETLDMASHRLDAWLTSLATKRLDSMRADQEAAGVNLGAYGWVENVRPAPALQSAPDDALIDPPGPVLVDPGNDGFMMAPSVNQASAAAILRSGYLTHATEEDAERFAVNLSSQRVRRALWLLEGIQQGQAPAALLGYRFERGLHENHPGRELDQYIYAFRELYPLRAGKLLASTAPVTAQAAANVIDGKTLLDRWRADRIPYGLEVGTTGLNLPEPGTLDHAAIEAELRQIADDLDALGDIGLAESVYQMILGNQERAGAILDTVAGQSRPQEPEVVRTPRTGVGISHRVLLLLSGAPPPPAGWVESPRAAAERALNAWLGQALGAADRVRCRVSFLTPDDVVGEDPVTLADLRVAPLDFVYMSGLEGPAGATELERRILHHTLKDLPAGSTASITFARDPDWGPEVLSFPEILEPARRLRETVTGARALTPEDLALPEEEGPTADLYDLDDLEARATAALSAISNAIAILGNALAPLPDFDPPPAVIPLLAPLRAAMLGALALGVPGAVPVAAAGQEPADYGPLLRQGRSVLNELAGRSGQAEESFQRFQDLAAGGGNPEEIAPRLREHLVDVIHAVFGASFRVLPRFRPRNEEEVRLALNHPSLLDPDDPDAPLRWFQQVARVSPALNRYELAALLVETLSGQTFDLLVGQLPFQDPDRWLGLPPLADQEVAAGRVSLITHAPLGFDGAAPYTGLYLDHLQERLPGRHERAGVSLHFNQPGARAPQTILLAVPPRRKESWAWDDLLQTVYDTLDLAKIRAVDPEALSGLGHYLPGIVISYNPADDAVSTDMVAHTYSALAEDK